MSATAGLYNTATLEKRLSEISGVSLVSIKNYTNSRGETENVIINIGASYEKSKQKDIEFLEGLKIEELETDLGKDYLVQAKLDLIERLKKPSVNKSEAQTNAYTWISNGLKIHNETGEVYVTGMKVRKTVKEEGEKKQDTRKPLTKAKDYLRSMLKSTKYRQYKVSKINSITLRGDTIEFS